MHLSVSSPSEGGGGHRVGVLTFSKKNIKIPTPGQKRIVKISRNKWLTSLLPYEIERKYMMSDQNPHPGDICHSPIPMGCPTLPPLGFDIDRCISGWVF